MTAVTNLSGLKLTGTGSVVANFALQHLKAATIFKGHVLVIQEENLGQKYGPFFEDIRSYASACIMSSAASLEALINEFFMAPKGALRGILGDFEAEFWGRNGIERRPVLRKYQLALEMLGKPQLDTKSVAFQDADALLALRNALVHFKPMWDLDGGHRVGLEAALGDKFEISPFVDSGADFATKKSMSSGCVCWAVQSALALMREFDARAKLDEHKMQAFWKLGD